MAGADLGTRAEVRQPVTQKSLYELLTKAGKSDKNGAALAAEWGLFNSTTKKLFGRTQLEPTQAQVLHLTKSGTKPPNTEWKYVPQNQMAISCRNTALNTCPGTSPGGRGQVWYMFNKPPLTQNVVGRQISSAQSDHRRSDRRSGGRDQLQERWR